MATLTICLTRIKYKLIVGLLDSSMQPVIMKCSSYRHKNFEEMILRTFKYVSMILFKELQYFREGIAFLTVVSDSWFVHPRFNP